MRNTDRRGTVDRRKGADFSNSLGRVHMIDEKTHRHICAKCKDPFACTNQYCDNFKGTLCPPCYAIEKMKPPRSGSVCKFPPNYSF